MRYLCSSIGKKQLMGITGLGWCFFVLSHMLGNLLYLVGPEAYNAYGHAITGNKPIYYTIEAGLLAFFVGHILCAIAVTIENRKARPVAYAVSPQGGKGGSTLAARTMALSGMVILVFTILHLIKFRFGAYYPFSLEGKEIRDLHLLITEVFKSFGYVVWYLIALFVLGKHLSHALWSSIQTLGLMPAGKEQKIRCLSALYGWAVAIGFAINPIYVYFFKV